MSRQESSCWKTICSEKGFGAHGHQTTSAPFTFEILEVSKSYIYVSPNIMALIYVGRYLQEKYMQKNPVKKYIVFWGI
jgi:hypothetical protein